MRVIDRCSFFFKLAQGEWVSPAKIELVLEQCPFIEQALVLGSPMQSVLVAVIVPSSSASQQFGIESPSMARELEPAARERFTSETLRQVRLWCRHHHLRPIEIPQAIHIEFEPWTAENGFYTSTLKKRRSFMTQHYSTVRSALYASLGTASADSTPPGAHGDRASAEAHEQHVSPELLQLLSEVMPVVPATISGNETFGNIGGDSLAAARLANLLRDRNVDVTIGMLYEHTLAHVSQLLHAASSTSSLTWVTPVVRASVQWSSEWRLPDDIASVAPASTSARGTHVFVTGGTGFLGPVLLRRILDAYPSDTEVYCLVRAANAEAARVRLLADMRKANMWPTDDAEHHTRLAARLHVLKGDLSQPLLGVSQHEWQHLVSSVGEIYHSGAWVNMALPYSALRPTNVGGTISIIRLALEARARVHFVSSVGALPHEPPSEPGASSEAWARIPSVHMDQKDGYSQTKAVSERLLCEAATRHGLDVRVFRASAISGHSVTGFANELDFTSMLLAASASVGAAVANAAMRLHWIPVDFVADAIVALARTTTIDTRSRVYHLTGNGPSMLEVWNELSALAGLRFAKPLEWLPAPQWKRRVASLPASHKAYVLLSQIDAIDFHGASSTIPTEVTRADLAAIGVSWPTIDASYIRRALEYLYSVSFLAAPQAQQ